MALIPEDVISQVIDRCDIVDTISAYVPLKRAGRNFKANCPFHHEKTPSFVVNPDKQIFHCFGCGEGGNIFAFLMKQEHLTFPEAVRLLAQKVNISLPEDKINQAVKNDRQVILDVLELASGYFNKILLSEKNKEENKTARDYLKARGVSLETVKKFQLGFAFDEWDGLLKYLKEKNISLGLMEKAGLIIPRGKGEGFYDRFRNRIMFPVLDLMGHCRAFGGRAIEQIAQEEKNSAKYINSPETPIYTKGNHLYGFHLAKQAIVQEDLAVIVEGYMDCVIPHQAGVANVVASLGTALTVEQIRLLRRFTKNVVMLFDMDRAGQLAILRALDILVEEDMHVRVATLIAGHDPDSFIREYGVELFKERIRNAQTLFDYKLSFLVKEYDIKTVEGKAKIAQEMLETIGKINHAVLKNGYVKRLTQSLGIAEEALNIELGKLEKSIERRKVEEVKESAPSLGSLNGVESDILKLILEEEDFIGPTKEEIGPADFKDQRVRTIIQWIYESFERGEKIHVGSLISKMEDQGLRQFLSSLLTKEEPCAGDRKKMHRDFVERIKMNHLKSLRQEFLGQMREAEVAGDHMKLDDLKDRYNQLAFKKR